MNPFESFPQETESSHKELPTIRSEFFEGTTDEEVINRVLARATDPDSDKDERNYLLKRLGATAENTPEEIREKIELRVEQYKTRLEELADKLPEQRAAISDYLQEYDITPLQKIEDVPVYLYDRALAASLSEDTAHFTMGGQFTPKVNAIVLSLDSADWVTVHEYAHALSYNDDAQRLGWRHLNEHGLPEQYTSNDWLDESCAMKLEFARTDHSLEDRGDEDIYYTFYKMSEVFQEQAGISDNLLLKGYYGDEAARSEVEQRCTARYGCSVSGLNEVMLGFNDELRGQTLDLLRGNQVSLKLHPKYHDARIERATELQNIFPNLSVEISGES